MMKKILELEQKLNFFKHYIISKLNKTWKVKISAEGHDPEKWYKVKDVVDTKKPWPHPEAGNMYHLEGVDKPIHQSKITDMDESDD